MKKLSKDKAREWLKTSLEVGSTGQNIPKEIDRFYRQSSTHGKAATKEVLSGCIKKMIVQAKAYHSEPRKEFNRILFSNIFEILIINKELRACASDKDLNDLTLSFSTADILSDNKIFPFQLSLSVYLYCISIHDRKIIKSFDVLFNKILGYGSSKERTHVALKCIKLSHTHFCDFFLRKYFGHLHREYSSTHSNEDTFEQVSIEVNKILVCIGNTCSNTDSLESIAGKIYSAIEIFIEDDINSFETMYENLASSEIPVKLLWELDKRYWKKSSFDYSDQYNEASWGDNTQDRYEYFQEKFDRWASRNQKFRYTNINSFNQNEKFGKLNINYIPYVENVFINILEEVCDAHVGISMDIRSSESGYVNTFDQLYNEKIQLAISSKPLERTHDDRFLFRSEKPIITFKGYTLLASTNVLYSKLNSTEEPNKDFITKILTGHKLDLSDPEELFQLGKIMNLCGYATLQNTDTEESLTRVFEEQRIEPPKVSLDLSPDMGLAGLLDGKFGFYIGGALQTHYAQKVFHPRIANVAEIPQALDLYMYASSEKNRFKSEEEAIDFINKSTLGLVLETWGFVSEVWEALRQPDEMTSMLSQSEQSTIRFLQSQLVSNLNVKRPNSSAGLIRNFEHLVDVITSHNSIYSSKNQFIVCKHDRNPVRKNKTTHKVTHLKKSNN